MKNAKPVISVILAGIFWGVINIFVKNLSAHGLSAMEICAVRMAVSVVVFGLFMVIFQRDKIRIRLKDIWIFLCMGIVSVDLFNLCYFYTMIQTQASVAVVLLYTSPVFIMILSAIFFKEKVTAIKIIALVLTLGGCVLVAGLIGGAYTITPLVILTGVLSGLFYGLYTIFGRVALKKYDTMTATFWTFVFGFLGGIPFGNYPHIISTVLKEPSVLFWIIGIGVISTVLPYLFYTWGLARMESSKAAILVAVEPLVGAVIGMTLFHESRDLPKIIGIILILAAIVLMNLPSRRAVMQETLQATEKKQG